MDRPREKNFWSRQRVTGLSVALVLVSLAVYASTLSSSTLRVDSRKLFITNVEKGPFQEFIPLTGYIQPVLTIYLDTVGGGRVEEIFQDEGSVVEEGTEILRLANTDLELDILRREEQLFEQINLLINTRLLMEKQARDFEQTRAELDFQILKQKRIQQRDELLFKEQLLSSLEYELSRDEYDFLLKERDRALAGEEENRKFRDAQIRQMEGSVDRARKNLEVARQELANLTIVAPISGQLSSVDAEIGQTKAPGQRLAQIDVTDEFNIRSEIEQIYLNRIQVGQEAEFDLDNTTYSARITKIYPEVMDGNFEVDLEFVGEAPQSIKRGQSLRIRLALGDMAEVTFLKRGAFFQQTGGQWVYVVSKSSDKADRRGIRLGRQNPEFFEVLEGLEPGERVIISSYEDLGEFEELIFTQ